MVCDVRPCPGFFLPIEQELGRALAHRRALGYGGGPVVAKIAILTLAVSVVVVIGLASSAPWLTSSYFSGDWLMFGALVIGFLSYAPVHLSRGICSGQGRFTPFAVVVASDGVMKIAGTIALTAIGITAIGAYAFAIAVAPLLAVVAIGVRPLTHQSWSPSTMARNHPKLWVAASRNCMCRRVAQRRPDRCEYSRQRE